MDNDVILSVKDLNVTFSTKNGTAKAVRDVSFDLKRGEKFGLVGESGSGKSVTSKSIIRLLATPPAFIEGTVEMNGVNLLSLTENQMCEYRGNHVSMIFQEPAVSLNPVFTIEQQLSEVIQAHDPCPKAERRARVLEMIRTVGIPSPETRLKQYPFELSGGMQQRVIIAMALLCHPEVLIADEPTTALDVTIQAQILDLLNQLNQEFGTSIILITHDLGVIAETVDRVAVMYCGNIVELAPVKELFRDPLHPYTRGLLKAVPTMQMTDAPLETIEGTVPSIYALPEGCKFCPRCPDAMAVCRSKEPPVTGAGENAEHQVRCWKYAAGEVSE